MATKTSASKEIPAPQEGLTREEVKSVSERQKLRAAVVYEIIRTEGEGELARTFGALWWSGLAAGISIGFSVLSQAMLATSLAGMPGAPIIAHPQLRSSERGDRRAVIAMLRPAAAERDAMTDANRRTIGGLCQASRRQRLA